MRKHALAAAAALLTVTQVASASDFTFTVPVALHNLAPEINQGEVRCYVYKPRDVGFGNSTWVGSGTALFAVVRGEAMRDVTVAFNANDPSNLPFADTYECKVTDFWTQSNVELGLWHQDASGRTVTTFPLSPSAPFVHETGLQPLP